MDCFYVSCERLRDPDLIDQPVIVGMNYTPGESRGAVATASYEARELGIESAMNISKALSILPDTELNPPFEPSCYYRPADKNFYREISQSVRNILEDFSDVTRHVSIDEAYLDVTSKTTWNSSAKFSQTLKDEIEAVIGVPSSIGIASSMSVAKMASAIEKPRGLVVVKPEQTQNFLFPLPIENLPGIGPVTAKSLHADGIHLIGELAKIPIGNLKDKYGNKGISFSTLSRGEDSKKVLPMGPKKSISRESSFKQITINFNEKKALIEQLSQDVGSIASSNNAFFRTVGIKIIEPPYKIHTREISFGTATNDPNLISTSAINLLKDFRETSVRKMGVKVSNLSFHGVEQTKINQWD